MNKKLIVLIIVVGSLCLWLNVDVPSMPTIHATPTQYIPPTASPLDAEKLTTLVNKWRVSQGLQPYVKDERLCVIAKDRADDGFDEHAGFKAKYMNNKYQISENLIGSVVSEKDALDGWLNSAPHKAALLANWKYSCIATGKFNAVEIFSNF